MNKVVLELDAAGWFCRWFSVILFIFIIIVKKPPGGGGRDDDV
jgi:hypothetical protein